jgi:hypothetical protein
MAMFDVNAIVHRFPKAATPQENLDNFKQIWGNFTQSHHKNPEIFKYLALFAVKVESGDDLESGDVRLAALLDYQEMAHCYLVIDGEFLGAANVRQISELLDATESFQAGREHQFPPMVYYCKIPAPRTEHMQDYDAARVLCGHLASFQRVSKEEFLWMFEGA